MTIQKLQALDMSNVQPEALQTAVQDILDDYKETNDKKAFEEIAKEKGDYAEKAEEVLGL